LKQPNRTARYGIFVAGLLLAGGGFLVYLGNALAMEGASDRVAGVGILGVVVGSVIAAVGIILGVGTPRRLARLASVLVGGLAGATGGWFLGSLLFGGGRFALEWVLALCSTPLGMWLGLLAGAGDVE
jgi:hypothetical protein